jgi:hypothetical protein
LYEIFSSDVRPLNNRQCLIFAELQGRDDALQRGTLASVF